MNWKFPSVVTGSNKSVTRSNQLHINILIYQYVYQPMVQTLLWTRIDTATWYSMAQTALLLLTEVCIHALHFSLTSLVILRSYFEKTCVLSLLSTSDIVSSDSS